MMKSALMIGVNPNVIREENDFYATDPKAMEVALPYLEKLGLSKNIWECACGEGHLSKVLISHGYNVYSTDLIDRGYGGVQDFLSSNKKWSGDILTNPPFKYAEQFVEKAMSLVEDGARVCFFLKIQFLESKARYNLFQKYPLEKLLIYSERQKCARNADFDRVSSSTQCYAWFVFRKGYMGEPTIEWMVNGGVK